MPGRDVTASLTCLGFLLALAGSTDPAQAHSSLSHGGGSLWRLWQWDPLVFLPMAFAAWGYAGGLRRLWSAAGVGAGIRMWQAAAFAAGWLTLALALTSPLDPVGEILFSFHMIQHQLVMLIAAPLLVLSSPLAAFLWSLPPSWRRPLGRIGQRRWLRAPWRTLRQPLVAWCLYAVTLWAWHTPILFEAALAGYWPHAFQHVTFLGAALVFWSTAFHPLGGQPGRASAVLTVFTTAVHSAILGALMTFASAPWYAPYRQHEVPLALTPLEDQQLAGLIMWVPGGLVHLLAGVALTALVIRQAELRARRRDAAHGSAILAPAGLER